MPIKTNELTHIYNPGTPFEHLALNGITVEIPKGKVTAIIGQTGSGKSTFVQHLNALLLPTSGRVEVDDYHIEAGTKLKDVKKSGSYSSFLNISFLRKPLEKTSRLVRKISASRKTRRWNSQNKFCRLSAWTRRIWSAPPLIYRADKSEEWR